MVRELGLKRRETVWSLSAVDIENSEMFASVREDHRESVIGGKFAAIAV